MNRWNTASARIAVILVRLDKKSKTRTLLEKSQNGLPVSGVQIVDSLCTDPPSPWGLIG